MGRLLYRKDIGLEAEWYFSDAYYSRSGCCYKWPSADWPHRFYIHDDKFASPEMVRLRKWIENTITDTVIVDSIEMDYRRYYGDDTDWDREVAVRNKWVRFSFENEHTATMFAITFSDLIQKPTNHHPDRPEDEEWLGQSNQHKQKYEL